MISVYLTIPADHSDDGRERHLDSRLWPHVPPVGATLALRLRTPSELEVFEKCFPTKALVRTPEFVVVAQYWADNLPEPRADSLEPSELRVDLYLRLKR